MWGLVEVSSELERQIWDEREMTFEELMIDLGFEDCVMVENCHHLKDAYAVYALKHRDYHRDKYVTPVFESIDRGDYYETKLLHPDRDQVQVHFDADIPDIRNFLDADSSEE